MQRKTPILYNALMLTGVNLLLRFLGTSFQVWLSGRIGAEGIGLMQLTLSVGNLAMVAGMAGIRTTAMYLTAGELGRRSPDHVIWVLYGCIRYSLVCSGTIALLLSTFAPYLAEHWIGNCLTVLSLRLFAGFLPVSCLTGVMVGYFTAANRIGMLAAVEVAEQLFSMTVTVLFLHFWARGNSLQSCESVILGSGLGSCLTLICLVILRLKEHSPVGSRIPVFRPLASTAIPLGGADVLKSGINTLENLLVPKRLALHSGTNSPLAAFGILSGMVFPVLMFPSAILFALAELLIPELARCHASGSQGRIRYLVRRSLKISFLYGLIMGGILFLTAAELSDWFYRNSEAGTWLRYYSLMVPMLYCDAVTDAMTKGLGKQKICVRNNIITSGMDVSLLFLLLPRFGMAGYYASFLITHLINFLLSIHLLRKTTGQDMEIGKAALALIVASVAAMVCTNVPSPLPRTAAFLSLLIAGLTLTGVIGKEDMKWFATMTRVQKVR